MNTAYFAKMLVNIAAVIDPSGCISHLVGSFTDITLQKQAEQLLNAAHDQMVNTVAATKEELELKMEESLLSKGIIILKRYKLISQKALLLMKSI